MILPESFTADWINSFRQKAKYKKIDPYIFERMIFALGLLEKLIENGLEFIFKGGTSLVLLLDDFKRFSTDIDIITTQSKDDIEKVLLQITNNSVFK